MTLMKHMSIYIDKKKVKRLSKQNLLDILFLIYKYV
jgi:hypothetical protein